MQFTGNEDHSIDLQDAVNLTANYRNSTGTDAFLASYFGKTALVKLLNQSGCVGIRIYNAKTAAGESKFVIVGVNANGEDLTGGDLLEFGTGCPPFCAPSSPLAGTA